MEREQPMCWFFITKVLKRRAKAKIKKISSTHKTYKNQAKY